MYVEYATRGFLGIEVERDPGGRNWIRARVVRIGRWPISPPPPWSHGPDAAAAVDAAVELWTLTAAAEDPPPSCAAGLT